MRSLGRRLRYARGKARTRAGWGATAGPGPKGSVLVLVLFTCLAVGVAIQVLCTVIVCAERALVDESVGRTRLEEKDRGLAVLRRNALIAWKTTSWTVVQEGTSEARGAISEFADNNGWIMRAVVQQQETVSRLMTSAWLERGRDGVDLPLAALVAEIVKAAEGRESPWLENDAETSLGAGSTEPVLEAIAYVCIPPAGAVLSEGCRLAGLPGTWRLDEGWRALGSVEKMDPGSGLGPTGGGEQLGEGTPSVAPTPGVCLLHSGPAGRQRLPADCGGGTSDAPLLIVVTGGADLDARDRGDLHAVIVVDDGGVLLDGTTVHGAVFVSETIDLGAEGRLIFGRSLLRWATDRSLNRVRLVPGTRWEGME